MDPGADGTMARVVSMTAGGHERSLSECRQLTVGDMEELGLTQSSRITLLKVLSEQTEFFPI